MKVKARLECVLGKHKPGEIVEIEKKKAEYYATTGWMVILGEVEQKDEKREAKPEPKKGKKK